MERHRLSKLRAGLLTLLELMHGNSSRTVESPGSLIKDVVMFEKETERVRSKVLGQYEEMVNADWDPLFGPRQA